jgi:hypothetical protein
VGKQLESTAGFISWIHQLYRVPALTLPLMRLLSLTSFSITSREGWRHL